MWPFASQDIRVGTDWAEPHLGVGGQRDLPAAGPVVPSGGHHGE
jgi:hypothetical protein